MSSSRVPTKLRGRALARWRQAEAVRLASKGMDYDGIAKAVGYANRGTAWRTVNKALQAHTVADVDQLRERELERLDRLQVLLWLQADQGDLKAVDKILKVIDQRCRLLGLDRQCRCERAKHEGRTVIAPEWMVQEYLAAKASE